jgi:tRNA/rRNA methyltransferase
MTTPVPPCVILCTPQLAENIGAVARVMANFGLSDLRLVNPRDGWPQERAWALASGATWPLDQARVFGSLAEAVADLHVAYATTARNRELQLPVITPRQAAADLHAASGAGQKVGLVYGGERTGMETSDVALCQAVVTIPIDPKFQSLNLAQAVAITAYEWRLTVEAGAPPRFREGPGPATQEAVMGFHGQLEQELDDAGFFHPPEKKPSMVQNLRSLFGRASMTDQEVRTMRGVITALSRGRGRVLEKLAKKHAAGAGDGSSAD